MGLRVVLAAAFIAGCVTTPNPRATAQADSGPIAQASAVRQLELRGPVQALNVLPLMLGLQAAMERGEKRVHVDIDSPGGYVNIGFNILRLMRAARGSGVVIECRVVDEGMAASMAAAILIAGCSERVVSPSGMVMMHEPAVGFEGGKEGDFRRVADYLADANQRLAIIIAARLRHADGRRWTAAEYAAWIKDRDRWVDASEALEMGAADSIG